MNKFLVFIVGISFVMFSGCSSKKVFEPKIVKDEWSRYGDRNLSIIDVGSNLALLEDRTVLTKDGIVNIKIDDTQRVISDSDGWIISSQIDGNLTLSSKESSKEIVFELKKTIATASVKDNNLAVLFADNEMALYNIQTKETILKEQGSKSLAVDARIVAPYFMNGLVVYSTLDGKVIIVNIQLKKRLRTIIVSSKNTFNNIIYFNIIDNKIIAATNTTILSISSKETRVKYEIRNIIYDNENIFITTKQGEVISLNSNLDLNTKTKFPFAHFLAMIADEDKLYLLEKEGYMIVLDKKDMTQYSVYNVNIEEDYLFIGDKVFYIDDEYISIK